jgi:AraC family transcriptional regulator
VRVEPTLRLRGGSPLGKCCYRARVTASPSLRAIASGRGYSINEYVCHAGPSDRAFEEQHLAFTIAAVVGGSFVYKTDGGEGLLHPGSLLLGNVGACYECGHEHSTGDRCVSFQFAPAYFEELAATAAGRSGYRFPVGVLPANDALLPMLTAVEAIAAVGDAGPGSAMQAMQLDELAAAVAEAVLGVMAGVGRSLPPSVAARDAQRISEVLRYLELHADEPLVLDELAEVAGLSKYHFLRTFRGVVGRSPYQYVLMTRMRRAALALVRTAGPVSAIALEAGFGDLSTFNRRFRDVFGVSPQGYRRQRGAAG